MDNCVEWVGARFMTGYGQRHIPGARSGKATTAHRVEWMIQRGEIPTDMFVLHHCDNPICVNIDHLWLGTPLDNMKDMVAKGRNRNRWSK